ncbi:hypothetical protein CRG98_004863 [Punica granatum]|uniref:Uncharacterized protein n=1 Tax=Punica granatum TaxID=22663 RepID=A0A2I0L224_PUNGR|nr:hypothetical protein CRG98_004863 [Punica granatum]
MAQDSQPASSEENTPPTPVYYQPSTTQALPPLTPAGAPLAHLGGISPPVPTLEAQAPSTSIEGAARIVALEGDISTLKGTEFHQWLNQPQLCNLDKEGMLGRICNTHLCRFPNHKSIANFWQLRKLDPWPLILSSILRIKIRISVVNTTWVLRGTLRTIVTPSGADCRR